MALITKRRLASVASASALIATVAVAAAPGAAFAATKTTNLWNVYDLNAGVTAYTPKTAPTSSEGIANFAFPAKPTTALLTTTKDVSLLGNLTAKTITATFKINGTGATFAHGGNQTCGTADANVRLYFAGDTRGNFTQDTAGYSKYWWANLSSEQLRITDQTLVLSVPVTAGNWSNWGGQLSSTDAITPYFLNAAAHVSEVGLSFGGGCGFANGVGTPIGTASFTLQSYSVASVAP
jgi:hypothetical protein